MKKEFVVCLAAKPVDVLWLRKIKYQTGPEWLGCCTGNQVQENSFVQDQSTCITKKVKSATLLNTSLLQEAKTMLMKMVQQRSFKDELPWLKSVENSNDLNKSLDKRSKISHLYPFFDGDEVIHIGGRL